MDYLTITSLAVHGVHGHYPHEWDAEQEFDVSLKVGVNTRVPGRSDKLSDTVDYDRLKAIVEGVFAGEKKYLLEALAASIASTILRDTPAREVTVSIEKKSVWPNGVPGVTITRSA